MNLPLLRIPPGKAAGIQSKKIMIEKSPLSQQLAPGRAGRQVEPEKK